jgi:heme exporter protein C
MGFLTTFSNPARFMGLSKWLAPLLGVLAAVCIAAGVIFGWTVPGDYQQGETIKIFFIHIPAAYMAITAYVCLAGASFFGLVFRHSLADAAAKAAAPLGAGFTALGLITGSLWGRPMWGTWWVWDGRLTSFLVLFLIYLGYMALHAALDDEQKAARAAAILALVGVVNLPIIHFSVEWWNTLHQGATVFAKGGSKAPKIYLIPMFLVMFGYTFLFGSLWLVRIRAEVYRRRANALQLQAAR